MKIVIDIPKEIYDALYVDYVFNPPIRNGKTLFSILHKCIAKGTQLPKGHGRLIDADALYDSAKLCHTEEDGTACVEWREINDAPTIVEAEGRNR